MHPGQVGAYSVIDPKTGKRPRFLAVRCGRRWGKTDYGKILACDAALKGKRVGWFAPVYRILSEAYNEIGGTLAPALASSSKVDGMMRLKSGGQIEWWTLENERAGRSRKYDLVVVDEAAFTKPNMVEIWQKAIMPTLLDYRGSALVLSNTNGDDPENFFWRICNEHSLEERERFGFCQYHAPTSQNPYMPREEIERLRQTTHPLVFSQEYEAEFVNWTGAEFFNVEKLLIAGQPIPVPTLCNGVFAVIDSATKTGTDNDGTAVTYFARMTQGSQIALVILDWDIVQIEGALLETWLPTVFQNLEILARQCSARMGSVGVFIEDKASGEILLQQAKRRQMNVHAIESRLTALGKDERAISVSGYVHNDKVKITQPAFDKVKVYKSVSRNHLIGQVKGFRIGDKDAAKRADDLLDTFTYGVSLALGDRGGF